MDEEDEIFLLVVEVHDAKFLTINIESLCITYFIQTFLLYVNIFLALILLFCHISNIQYTYLNTYQFLTCAIICSKVTHFSILTAI